MHRACDVSCDYVNVALRSNVIGDVYRYVHDNNLHEFFYSTAMLNTSPLDAVPMTFQVEDFRRTLCGMLRCTQRYLHTFHYVIVSGDEFLDHLSSQTQNPTQDSTIFIFEYHQAGKTHFSIATLVHSTQTVDIHSISSPQYNTLFADQCTDHNKFLSVMEAYVHAHTPAVSTLVTVITPMFNLSADAYTFDSFVWILVKYSNQCLPSNGFGFNAKAHSNIIGSKELLQQFTTMQLVLAVQYVHTVHSDTIDLLLDELNYVDSLNAILPPLSISAPIDIIFEIY
jgi:hypothetical protein